MEEFHAACFHPIEGVKIYDFTKRFSWVLLQLCAEKPEDGNFGVWEVMMIEARAVLNGWNDDWVDGDDPNDIVSPVDIAKHLYGDAGFEQLCRAAGELEVRGGVN